MRELIDVVMRYIGFGLEALMFACAVFFGFAAVLALVKREWYLSAMLSLLTVGTIIMCAFTVALSR